MSLRCTVCSRGFSKKDKIDVFSLLFFFCYFIDLFELLCTFQLVCSTVFLLVNTLMQTISVGITGGEGSTPSPVHVKNLFQMSVPVQSFKHCDV